MATHTIGLTEAQDTFNLRIEETRAVLRNVLHEIEKCRYGDSQNPYPDEPEKLAAHVGILLDSLSQIRRDAIWVAALRWQHAQA